MSKAAKSKARGKKSKGRDLAIPVPGPGRNSKYREEFADQAFKLTLLGAIDEELADFFGVAVSTIYKWQNEHPAFSEAIHAGKAKADAEVAHSLYQRATGHHFTAEKVVKKDSGEFEAVRYKQFLPGDPQAAFRWLMNRRSQDWRDARAIEITGKNGGPVETITTEMTAKEAAERYRDELG